MNLRVNSSRGLLHWAYRFYFDTLSAFTDVYVLYRTYAIIKYVKICIRAEKNLSFLEKGFRF